MENRSGYYTVQVSFDGLKKKIPYIVFANSDYQAAKIVKDETGYMAPQHDVQGPFARI